MDSRKITMFASIVLIFIGLYAFYTSDTSRVIVNTGNLFTMQASTIIIALIGALLFWISWKKKTTVFE